jgi:ACR3 family arsenite transporter
MTCCYSLYRSYFFKKQCQKGNHHVENALHPSEKPGMVHPHIHGSGTDVVIQIQSAAWYVHFVDKIFGTAKGASTQIRESVSTAALKKGVQTPSSIPFENAPLVPIIQKILYATDLSETARHAARYACSLGHQYAAQVTVLHVIPDLVDHLSTEVGINLADHIHKTEWTAFHQKGIEKAKQAITRRIRETSQKVVAEIPHCLLSEENILVGVGNPAKEIVAAANQGNFDLIILGTHGHGKLERTLIGSIAGDVIRQSSLPVLVVRLPLNEDCAEIKEASGRMLDADSCRA